MILLSECRSKFFENGVGVAEKLKSGGFHSNSRTRVEIMFGGFNSCFGGRE